MHKIHTDTVTVSQTLTLIFIHRITNIKHAMEAVLAEPSRFQIAQNSHAEITHWYSFTKSQTFNGSSCSRLLGYNNPEFQLRENGAKSLRQFLKILIQQQISKKHQGDKVLKCSKAENELKPLKLKEKIIFTNKDSQGQPKNGSFISKWTSRIHKSCNWKQ
jgi:hypothetical protein